jgi:uncharacterized protein involved in tolerance to divalent cations
MTLLSLHTTVGSEAGAQALARAAVGQRVAACVHIDRIASVYRWQGRVQQEAEWRLSFKTTAAAAPALRALLQALHPYELPALYATEVGQADAPFSDWVHAECAGAPQAALAAALLRAVQAQELAATPDRWQGGAPLGCHPGVDLAVVAFAPGAPPRWANVLFSREHPRGHVAAIAPDGGAPGGLRFERDLQGAAGDSVAWAPGADWAALPRVPLLAANGAGGADGADAKAAAGCSAGGPAAAVGSDDPGDARFVAPYPASLLKLMVAVGVGLAVDRGLAAWPDALEPMITLSSNEATDDCVALLHRSGLLGGARSALDPLNACFAAQGLATLQLNDTTPAGGWRNADGSGVGHIHMTAWDTVRLLWLLDADAPPAPWLPPGTPPLLQPATRERLRGVLARQQLDQVLSSGSLRGQPGWVAGLPDAPAFAHKTGTTDNYASDAGIVRSGRTHYIVALLSSLGRRYAATDACATTWRLPALGAAIHALMESND